MGDDSNGETVVDDVNDANDGSNTNDENVEVGGMTNDNQGWD